MASACLLDFVLAMWWRREVAVPLSAYITALSVGILLESYDWRIYVVAAAAGLCATVTVYPAPQGAPLVSSITLTADGRMKMTVTVDDEKKYQWKVSTGGVGYDTPSGSFRQ